MLRETTQEKMAESFANLRKETINLEPVLVLNPQLVQAPTINAQGLMLLAGLFPSQPLQVRFQFTYQPVDGAWRLAGSKRALNSVSCCAKLASMPKPCSSIFWPMRWHPMTGRHSIISPKRILRPATATAEARGVVDPFSLLWISDDPALQREAARTFVARTIPGGRAPPAPAAAAPVPPASRQTPAGLSLAGFSRASRRIADRRPHRTA